MEKMDIKNSKEMLNLIFGLGFAIKKSLEDGIDVSDTVNLIPVISQVGPAFDDAGMIVAEMKDLDEEEVEELVALAKSKIGEIIDEEELLEKIELGMKAALAVYEFVSVLLEKDEEVSEEA